MYERYAALRDKKGVSDYRVAADLGFSRTTLTQWRQGICRPKLDKLMLLANYFKVPLEELIGEKA